MENISRANNLIPLLNELEQKYRVLNIIETGTIRNINEEYHIGDGHSTFYITQWLKERNYKHRFYSIDLDISVASDYLNDSKINLVKSDSIKFLTNFNEKIHFAYLDSANDADIIYKEFLAVLPKMVKYGIIVIDDAIPQSTEVVKIHKVLPYLQQHNFNYYIQNKQCVIKL